jgi:hypothetical protein
MRRKLLDRIYRMLRKMDSYKQQQQAAMSPVAEYVQETEQQPQLPLKPECKKICPVCCVEKAIPCCLSCEFMEGLDQFNARVKAEPDNYSLKFNPNFQRADSVRFWCRADFTNKATAKRHTHKISEMPVSCSRWKPLWNSERLERWKQRQQWG